MTEQTIPTEPGIYTRYPACPEGELLYIFTGDLFGWQEVSWGLGRVRDIAPPSAVDGGRPLVRLKVPASPKPTLPTEAGAYHDRDGDLWVLDIYAKWAYALEPGAVNDPENYLPFVRLVPEVTE